MKFKAAVLHKSGQELVVEDIEAGPLKSGDVLIRLCASGLCHTDLEVIQGSIRYPSPSSWGMRVPASWRRWEKESRW